MNPIAPHAQIASNAVADTAMPSIPSQASATGKLSLSRFGAKAATALSRLAAVAMMGVMGLLVVPTVAQAATASILINKGADKTTYNPGEFVTYTLEIKNAGPDSADGTTYTDTLEVGSFVPSSITTTCVGTLGAACTAGTVSGTTVSGTVATLPNGGIVTITIKGQLNSVGANSVKNTAYAALPAGLTDGGSTLNNTVGISVNSSKAKPAIVKTQTPGTLAVGTPITYKILVTNSGSDTAYGLVFGDYVINQAFLAGVPNYSAGNPDIVVDMSSISCTPTGVGSTCPALGSFSQIGAGVTTNVTTMFNNYILNVGAGGQVEFTYTVTPTKFKGVCGGVDGVAISNLVYTRFAGSDLNAGVQSSVASVLPPLDCKPAPDIEVIKTQQNANWSLPGTNTYTIKHTNKGPGDVTNLELVDYVGYNLGTGSMSASYADSTITCTASNGAICPPALALHSMPFTINGSGIATMYDVYAGSVAPLIPEGGVITLTVVLNLNKATICKATSGQITNKAYHRNGSGQINSLNDVSDAISDVLITNKPCVDLAVAKSVNKALYAPGESITFTVDISSAVDVAKFSTATNIPFTDNLPGGFVYTSSSCAVTAGVGVVGVSAGGLAYNAALNQLTGTMTSLDPGGVIRCTINGTATLEPAKWGAQINSVTIPANTSTYGDLLASSNTSDATFKILGKSDLSISKTNNRVTYVPGGTTRYTIVIGNQGTDIAVNTIFKDPAVPNLTVTGVTCPSSTLGAIPPAPADISVALLQGAGIIIPRLTNGGTVTCYVDATVSATATGPLANTATIQLPATGYTVPEADMTNNTATDTDYPAPTLTKTFNPKVITTGEASQLTFTITNPAGNPAVTGISFTDNLPANLIIATPPLVNNLCTPGGLSSASAGSSTITFTDVGVLAATAGAANTCTITVNVTNVDSKVTPVADRAACLANTITPGNTDFTNKFSKMSGLVGVNNGVTDQCLVVDPAVPTLEKSFNPTNIAVGGITTLTFTLKNPKGNPATTVTFTDTLPANLTIATPSNIGGGPNACSNYATAVATTASGNTPARVNATGVALAAGGAAGSVCTFTVAVTAIPNVINATCPEAGGATNFTNSASNISGNTTVGTAISTAPMVASCVTVTGSVNLGIGKSASTAAPVIGTPFIYTLTVKNSGDLATSGAYYIADDIDASRLNVTAITPGAGWSCTPSSGFPITTGTVAVRCNSIAVLAAGATSSPVTISVVPTAAAATGVQPLKNVAAVGGVGTTPTAPTSGGGGELTVNVDPTENTTPADPKTNVAGLPLSFTGKVDLVPTKTVSSSAQNVGTPYTYTIAVKNIGNLPSNAIVTVTDQIPPNLQLNSMTAGTLPGAWSCVSSAVLPATAPLVTCTLPATLSILANGTDVTVVTLNVTPMVGIANPTSNTANVSGGGENPGDSTVTGNNSSTVPVNFVNGKMGLAKNLQSVTSTAVGTYTIKYRYKVRNDGTGNLPNVQINDDLRAVYGAAAVITGASITPVAGSAMCPAPTPAPAAWPVNAGYTGTGNNAFFALPNAGLAALNCEASFDLTFTVSGIKPVSNVGSNTVNTLSFDNTATTSSQINPADPTSILATDSSVNSKTLDPKQGNAGVDASQPVNNTPTPVLLPAVGTAKAVGTITQFSATQIDVPYTVKVRNMGGTVLDPVTTIDNLATTFPGLTTAISAGPVATVTTAGNCAILSSYFGTITETAAANAAYNGQADTNLLALTGSKLCPGGEITITFTVRVTNPVAGTTYNNVATASGVGKTDPTDPNNPAKSLTVSDASTNGLNPDPNGDGIPTESVPTPVVYTPQKIDIAKAAGVPTQTGPSTFNVPYTLVVKNTGTIPATNVQVEDNLATTFATGAPVVTISTAAATAAPCTINPTAFNGVANTRLLVGTNTLAVGESCTITFTANVAYPSVAAIPPALQNNTAVANTYAAPPATPGGPSTGTPVATDTSTTGTPPPPGSPPGTPPTTPTPVPGDTPTPTPVQFVPQKIDVVKAVGTYKQTGAKTFEVPYSVVVGNVGATSPTVYNIQADDNLKATFPTASTVTVSGYTVAAVAPTPAASCTPAVPAFAGTAAASKMLSGTGDLAGGQACVITFIANVDFGANPVPTTIAQNNTVYASGVGQDSVVNPGYTVTDAGVATPPSVATTTDVSVDNVTARPPAGSPAGTPPTVPALPATPGADPATGVPTPVLLTPQKIDVVKAAGVPLQVGPKKFWIDYSVVVGNVGAASPTVFNVQANDNLKVTYPTAASITVSNYVVAPVAPTPAANCTAATPTFAGTAAASAMLSGTNDLLGGQSCLITFKVLVDFGAADIPVAPQNNTVYASGVGSDAVVNPGYTVPDTGVATPPAVASTTDISVTAPPTKGDPGTPPAVPALPATPGADVPAGVPTPVVLVGQKIDTVKAVGVPKQVGPKVFEVNYSVVVANVCKASPLTCATTPTVFNVQANDNLANTFPTASSIVVSNYAVANGANGAVCSPATPAYAGTAAASAMLSGADDLTGGQTCIITFKATVDFGANPIPLTPQNNTVYASGTGANTIVNPGYTYGADGKPVPPANASTTDISSTAPPTTGAPGTLPTTPVPPTLPGGDSDLGIPTPIVLLVDDGGLNIVKSTVTKEASAGDVVVYSVTVTNTSSVAVANAKVTDTPPVGFVYVPGSAKIGGSSVTSSNNGSSIIFDIGTIAAKSSLVLTYQMKLGDAVEAGEASNCVSANGVSIFGFDKESGKSCATVIIKTGLFLEKRANVTKAEIGDSVEYSLRVKSVGGTTKNVTITDNLPLGFKLIDGTVKVIRGGVTSAAANPAGSPGPVLTFNVGTVVNKEVVEIRYRLRLGVGADLGDGINKAQAKAPYATSSLVATAKVLVTRGVFTREACIVGKVFVDCNQNKVQDKCEAGSKDACEPGIPGVRLYMEDGTNITTDENGQYSICGVRAITHVMQVDMTTMPVGSRMGLTSNENLGSGKSLMMNIKSGELHRADFIESSCYPKILEQVEQRRKNSAGIVNVPLIQKGQDKPGIVFDSKEQELLAPALRGVK